MTNRTKTYKRYSDSLHDKECIMCFKKFQPKKKTQIKCGDLFCRNTYVNLVNKFIPKNKLGEAVCVYCGNKFIKKSINNNCCGKIECKKARQSKLNHRGYNLAKTDNKEKKRNIIYRGYKEPLIPLPGKYYGYDGVILEDEKSGEIQCCICGKWFKHLGCHLQSHKKEISLGKYRGKQRQYSRAYKNMFGLMKKTPLCSTKISEKIVKRVMTYPWERLQKNGKNLEKFKNERGGFIKKSAEKHNIDGTCFMQLLDLIKKQAIKVGRTPKSNEFKSYKGTDLRMTITNTFGSIPDAVRLCKLTPNTNGIGTGLKQLTDEFLLECIKNFVVNFKRRPTITDCDKQNLPHINNYIKAFGSWRNAKIKAFEL